MRAWNALSTSSTIWKFADEEFASYATIAHAGDPAPSQDHARDLGPGPRGENCIISNDVKENRFIRFLSVVVYLGNISRSGNALPDRRPEASLAPSQDPNPSPALDLNPNPGPNPGPNLPRRGNGLCRAPDPNLPPRKSPSPDRAPNLGPGPNRDPGLDPELLSLLGADSFVFPCN